MLGLSIQGPEFTYDDEDRVLRVDYDDGSYKTFEYDDGLLTVLILQFLAGTL